MAKIRKVKKKIKHRKKIRCTDERENIVSDERENIVFYRDKDYYKRLITNVNTIVNTINILH